MQFGLRSLDATVGNYIHNDTIYLRFVDKKRTRGAWVGFDRTEQKYSQLLVTGDKRLESRRPRRAVVAPTNAERVLLDIYLDMDGVIADFNSAAFRAHGRPDLAENDDVFHNHNGPIHLLSDIMGIPEEDFWKPIDALGEPFWVGLKPYEYARDVVALCRRFGTVILASDPSARPQAASGKMKWIAEHFPELANHNGLITIHEKFRLAKPQAVLVDDRSKITQPFVAAGGMAILFPQPWNAARGWTRQRLTRLEYELRECEATCIALDVASA